QAAFLGLTSAFAHRHRPTAMHCRRVADLCMLTAPGLLSPEDAAELEVAALLHDIGKLGVPDAILFKPGALTPQEWEIMRSHDYMGVDIVNAAGMPAGVISIIAAHHARFNNTNGGATDNAGAISNESLPLAARVLSVTDAFDAMTTRRPYRKRLTESEALAELRRCAGTQFDPMVVEHFARIIVR